VQHERPTRKPACLPLLPEPSMKSARFLLLLVPFAALLALSGAVAQDKKDEKKSPPKKVTVATDPKDAGVDFEIQGEYAPASKSELAAQVVARGGGKFDVYFLEGGLPGAGWNGKSRTKSAATLGSDEKSALIKGAGYAGSITLGEKTMLHGESEKGGKFSLTRIVRKSPTLGAKPPDGARVLFDGSNADSWKEGKLAGNLIPVAANTKEKFKFAKLHVEFVSPFMPYAGGQGRGNSGVYFVGQNGPEIQVLDSFGLKGENNECGGIYGRRAPDVNMCFPPLSWQTYDVELKREQAATKVTVYHNGVKIHEDVDIGKNDSGPIHLQNHGDRVFFKNIWLVEAK
jgi:Domain of Unknown Function (DUF1080)